MGLVATVLVLLFFCLPAAAQWATQTFTLTPGWNAVYLEIEPYPNTCDAVFAELPIESVWYWTPDTSPVQFITKPEKLKPEDPDWRVYFPRSSLAHTLTTLRVVRGNRPYMIKLAGDQTIAWTLQGNPSVRSTTWVPDSYNLVGFPVAPDNAPSFSALFAASPAHANRNIFRLIPDGHWELVDDRAAAAPRPGEAFWVYTAGVSDYQGMVPVTEIQLNGLRFGRILTELSVRLYNESAAEKQYTLTPRDSAPPADPNAPALAGAVPLAYWREDYDNEDVGWRPLTGPVTLAVDAGAWRSVRLAVMRNQMAAPEEKVDGEFLYQSVLEVSDGQGGLRWIPVTAEGLTGASADKMDQHPLAGLWIGAVTLNAVNEPAGVDPTTPLPTGSEFTFQIIVHVDAAGTPRFLQQVTQLWKEPVFEPNPADPRNPELLTPGKYVLITEDALLSQFQGAGERGGVPVGRRFSCPAFSFREPKPMIGAFPTPDSPAESVGCVIVLDYDDPLNPFKHKYHPDHNNLDARYEHKLPEGVESFTVVRDITLEFIDYSAQAEGEEAPPVLLSAYAGWGDAWLGGVYREVVTGIHRDTLYVEGDFELRYISDVTELNPEG